MQTTDLAIVVALLAAVLALNITTYRQLRADLRGLRDEVLAAGIDRLIREDSLEVYRDQAGHWRIWSYPAGGVVPDRSGRTAFASREAAERARTTILAGGVR